MVSHVAIKEDVGPGGNMKTRRISEQQAFEENAVRCAYQ